MIGVLLVMVGPAALSFMTPVLPLIAEGFDISQTLVKFTMTGYMLGLVAGQVLSGTLSDAFGRKTVALGFMVLFCTATLAAVLSTSITMLIAARVVQGVGAAAGWATARAMVRDLFDGRPAARVMSNITMFMGVTPAIVPVVGGITGELGGWHAVFVLMLITGLAILTALAIWMPETNAAPEKDAIALFAIIASYRDILGNDQFRRSAAAMGGAVGVMYALLSIMPYILIDQMGYSPAAFGGFMVIQAASAGTAAWLNGRLVSRFRLATLTKFGLGIPLCAAVLLGLALLFDAISAGVVVLAASATAAGNALVMPNAATLAVAPFARRAGAAASLIGLAQVGLGFLGSLIAALVPSAPLAMVIIPLLFAGFGLVTFARGAPID